MRSIGERIWEQAKRIFLREVAKKEEAAQMRKEQLGTSEYIIAPTKQRSRRHGYLNRLVSRIWPTRRRVGTAPAPEHN